MIRVTLLQKPPTLSGRVEGPRRNATSSKNKSWNTTRLTWPDHSIRRCSDAHSKSAIKFLHKEDQSSWLIR